MSAPRPAPERCPRHGTALVAGFDTIGRTVVVCEQCQKHPSGCIECPNKVKGRSKRCGKCQYRRHRALERRRAKIRRKQRPGKEAAYKRQWYANLPADQKAKEIARRKKWRAENPLKVAAHRRKARLKGTMGYRTRDGYLAATRQYRAAHRQQIRDRDRARYQAKHPPKPCKCETCGVDLPYFGKGARPKWCETHRPYLVVKKRRESRWQDRQTQTERKER